MQFSEGLAPVSRAGKWGYIDLDGHVKIPLIYQMATPFSNGIAHVKE